MIGTFLTKNLS